MSNPISNQVIPISADYQPVIGDYSRPPVAHHVHKDSEPLPGAKGAAPTFDYSPDTITHANIPASEIGNASHVKPHDTHAPVQFAAPGNAGSTPGAHAMEARDPLAPYQRTDLKNALNNGQDDGRQDMERKLLGNPQEMHGSHQHQTAPSVGLSHADKFENNERKETYDIDGQPKLADASTATANTNMDTEHTKPSIADRVIGTTEKIAGKVSRNPELQEKGELRKTGGDPSDFVAVVN